MAGGEKRTDQFVPRFFGRSLPALEVWLLLLTLNGNILLNPSVFGADSSLCGLFGKMLDIGNSALVCSGFWASQEYGSGPMEVPTV